MQYDLWFILLGILAVPFLPFRLIGVPQILSWLSSLRSLVPSGAGTASGDFTNIIPAGNADWMNDFAFSVNIEPPSGLGSVLSVIWFAGIFAAITAVIIAYYRLYRIKRSSLPLQNREVSRLYQHCLEETGIRMDNPVYSTAFLKSPIIVGQLYRNFVTTLSNNVHNFSCGFPYGMPYILMHEKNRFMNVLFITLNIKNKFRKNQKEDQRMMNAKINDEALKQVTGGRGYDRDDDPKCKDEGDGNLLIECGVPLARWFCNTKVGRWVCSAIS